MNSTHNIGIVINGGAVTAHQLVAGSHAHAENTVHASQENGQGKILDDLRQQLDALLALMYENRHCVALEATQAMEVVRQEAAKPEPNKLMMSSVLDQVSGTVKSFASIAGAITAVTGLVAQVL